MGDTAIRFVEPGGVLVWSSLSSVRGGDAAGRSSLLRHRTLLCVAVFVALAVILGAALVRQRRLSLLAEARERGEADRALARARFQEGTALLKQRLWAEARDKLHALIKRHFALDEAAADELVTEATQAEHQAVDLYHFTSLINRSLDEAGRRRVVEMMWEIAYADGHVSEFEDNLLWRAADLLGVSSRERIAARQRVAGEKAESEGT